GDKCEVETGEARQKRDSGPRAQFELGMVKFLTENNVLNCAGFMDDYLRNLKKLRDRDAAAVESWLGQAANYEAAEAAYWKQHHNTPLGKGTAEEFTEKFENAVIRSGSI
ncbi:MAG: hypothetical protein MI741_00385, partial [Rhodospirillales bacterium]|nr:hypothetical protein [Rhodospirillales bacterium]